MWSFFEFLNDDCTLTILDIGAALTETPSYQRLIDAKRVRLIGFEPDADECRKLNEAYGAPHRFFSCFVGDGRPAVFHETNCGQTGSLFEPNTPLLEIFHDLGERVVPLAQHPVTTTRLDDLTAELGDVDFLKIDVQGSELAVFQHGSKVLANVMMIQAEVGFVECYKQQPMFSDVDVFLRRQGFQFHEVGFGSRSFKPVVNPGDVQGAFHQRIWGDAFYVRDWMQFDTLPPVKLRKLAALLHEIIGSYDLAHFALQAMDRQLGTDIAPRYLRRLLAGGHCAVDGCEAPAAGPVPPTVSESDRAPAETTSAVVLKTTDSLSISVPASLKCITTYVLLEQEKWFEREVGFTVRFLAPGMNAIDVGANVGVYSLPMARALGPAGQVFAFEPGAENRMHLEAGRIANDLANLQVLACALADAEKEGWLQIGSSGELNSLADDDSGSVNGERVLVSTLDAQARLQRWPSIDFIKIDAEGQEARIVAGGRELFARHSPLVMFEIKHGAVDHQALRWMFEALGYHTYRLLGDASCLVPVGSDEVLDGFELNLFAARPDRAAALAERGLLVPALEPFSLSDTERERAIDCLLDQPFARAFEFSQGAVLRCDYSEGLVAYAAARFVGLPAARRVAALDAAAQILSQYCALNPSPTGLATLARVALDQGHRVFATRVLKQLLSLTGTQIDQPFFPSCARFEALSPEGQEADWFVAAAIEQLALSSEYSSMFAGARSVKLESLCRSPFASPEIVRRMILASARAGMSMRDLVGLINPECRHENASFWTESGLAGILSWQ